MSSVIVDSVAVEFGIKQDLKIGFHAKKKVFSALRNINLTLADGDRVGVLGQNGAGKTTLLRVISGVLPATKGSVKVSGNMHAALSLRTGLLNQASCLENIRLRAYYYGFKGDAVDRYVERVRDIAEMEEFIYQPLKSLSNGMRSRLMISMFLINEPSIVLFDEWVGVLDRTQLDGVASLKRVVDDSDITIFASHNIGFIQKYCNRCIVLDRGELVFEGAVEESIAYYNEATSIDVSSPT